MIASLNNYHPSLKELSNIRIRALTSLHWGRISPEFAKQKHGYRLRWIEAAVGEECTSRPDALQKKNHQRLQHLVHVK